MLGKDVQGHDDDLSTIQQQQQLNGEILEVVARQRNSSTNNEKAKEDQVSVKIFTVTTTHGEERL